MSYRTILKLRYFPFLPLVALLLIAIACGGDDATAVPATAIPPTSAPLPTAPVAATLPASQATPTPLATAKAATSTPAPVAKVGKKLRVALPSFDSELISPHLSGKLPGVALQSNFADFLMGVTVNNELTNDWGWADGWEMVDPQRFDITIKGDIAFHDGFGIVDAEDVADNLDILASQEAAASQCLYCGTWVDLYDRTEILEPLKVRIHTQTAYVFLFNLLPPIGGADLYMFSLEAWKQGGETATGYEDLSAPATGPWDFTERKIGEFVRFGRWDDYYSEAFRPRYEELEMVLTIEDASRLALVQTGAVEMAPMSGAYVDEIRRAGLTIDGPHAVDTAYVAFYQSEDAGHCTNKLEVRKALNLAVDADAIAGALYFPGTYTRIPHAFTSAFVEGYNPTLKPYGYDPDEAKRILQAEGCADMKVDGYSYVGPSTPEWRDLIDSVITYFEAVGIQGNHLATEWAAYSGKVLGEKMSAAEVNNPIGPHWIPSARNFGEMIRTHGLCVSRGGSVCGLAEQDRWNALRKQYNAEVDAVARQALAADISRQLYDFYPHIPIASRDAIWALDPDKICEDWEPIDGTSVHLMLNTIDPC